MKKLSLFLISCIFVFGISFENKEGRFTQTIVNDLGKEIVYTGEISIDGDNLLWSYETPIEKSILIKGTEVIITEPEIYQITVVRREEGINLKRIYESSTVKSENLREVEVDGVMMNIYEGKDFIEKILFKDKLDNQVSIIFNKVESKTIDSSKFTASFPSDFDIVYR